MTKAEERAYALGETQLARRIMSDCLKALPETEWNQKRWQLERADITIALRSLCTDMDWDVDWEPTDHLGDVINKIPR